jgi:hypothetical protein
MTDSGATSQRLLGGVRFDPEATTPQLWFMADTSIDDDGDRVIDPILRDGRLVVFADPGGAPMSGAAAEVEPDVLIDVAHALYSIESDVADPDGLVFESLMMLVRLVDAVGQTMPQPKLSAVVAAAEAMRADGPAGLDDGVRSRAIDGVLWAVGAVAVLTTVG